MSNYDVALIGLGPVGCAAAILFAEAGLKVVAFERDTEVYRLPRAVNLDGEIIRAFQSSGRGKAVEALMQPVRPGDRAGFANSMRQWMFGVEASSFGSNGWQPMSMFDQPEFENYLRQQAVTHPLVTAYVGVDVHNARSDDDGVSITYGDDEVVVVRYAVACDGAASETRKALGIDWLDLGYDHDWLVVDVTTKKRHTLGNDTLQVCDPDRISTYVCTKDPFRRWEFKLLPGETAEQMLETETIMSLIDPWTPRDTYEIRRAAVYQFHAAIAAKWRDGNIFIAGDAAHQTPPFLGQGMNIGMRDVINLAWKLPMVVRGQARDALLDTYYSERNAHAHDLVEWAVEIGKLMEHLAEVERCQRSGLALPEEQTRLKSSGYGQGREQPPIREGAVVLDQVGGQGSTGYLFSQPIVENASGKHFRLDELLGAGIAIVTSSARMPVLANDTQAVVDQLGISMVSISKLSAVKGHFDRLFEQYETAIVRPDRIVFGHTTDKLSLDDLIRQLARKLDIIA